jgi:arylformamidase
MSESRIYDVSLTIDPKLPVNPGNPQITLELVKSMTWGGSSNVSLLHIGTHTGTHVDAPCHFIPGAPGIDVYKPDVLVGKARLFQLAGVNRIDRLVLGQLDLSQVTRVILGTSNSYTANTAAIDHEIVITEDGARLLVEKGIILIGIDNLSHEEYHKEVRPVHEILLGAGIAIVEGLDLVDVPAGDYEIMCLPLKIKGGDGAPARVFLREIR